MPKVSTVVFGSNSLPVCMAWDVSSRKRTALAAGCRSGYDEGWQGLLSKDPCTFVCGTGATLSVTFLARRFRRLRGVVAKRAARVGTNTSVEFLRTGTDGQVSCVSVAEGAPASGASSADLLSELAFLIKDPFHLGLRVNTRASTQLRTSPDVIWQAFVGSGERGLESSWRLLNFGTCYGIPLQLLRLSGEARAGSVIVGEFGLFDVEIRQLRWSIGEATFSGSDGKLVMEGQIVGEESPGFKHSIALRASGEGGCEVSSEITWEPSLPVQTLLNAAGGRKSTVEGNAALLRRLGVVAGGDVDFDPPVFYNTVGRAVDLLAPFEDEARVRLAQMAGFDRPNAGLRVLECGCGTGRWAKQLAENEGCIAGYVGIDSSVQMASIASQELASLDSFSVVRADARVPDALAQSCTTRLGGPPDRIVLNYVLDIIDDADLDGILEECKALLVESGGSLAACSIMAGSPFMGAWEGVWRANPWLVGGCRPVNLAEKFQQRGWELLEQDQVDVFGYTSQVILAKPKELAAQAASSKTTTE